MLKYYTEAAKEIERLVFVSCCFVVIYVFDAQMALVLEKRFCYLKRIDMKTRVQLISLFLTVLLTTSYAIGEKVAAQGKTNGSVSIFTSKDLMQLAESLVDGYGKVNPNHKLMIYEEGINSATPEGAMMIVNDNQLRNRNELAAWSEPVGRTVVVAIVGDKFPYLNELKQKGVNERNLQSAIRSPRKWNDLVRGIQGDPIHVYVSNDKSIDEVLLNWTHEKQFSEITVGLMDAKLLVQKILSDPCSIGFCSLADISDAESGNIISGVSILPIDRNGNGKIDYMENISENLQSFTRGVWIGKYPRELTSAVYLISSVKPQNESEIAFLKWVLTDGQKVVANNNLTCLNYNEQLAELSKLDEPEMLTSLPTERTNSAMSVILLVLIVIVLGGALVEFVFRAFAKRSKQEDGLSSETPNAFTVETVDVPKGLYFEKSHSWAFMKKNGVVKVGIDDFLQHVTGKITKVEMKERGVKIRKGDQLCSIVRKGKVLHVYSPVTGTILEVNEKLKDSPSLVNSNPYSDGWIYAIEPVNWELEQQYLQMADKVKANLNNEFQRLKDFIDSVLKLVSPDYAYSVLQDGGTFVDHPLAEFGPDVWDDFQTKFIDSAK